MKIKLVLFLLTSCFVSCAQVKQNDIEIQPSQSSYTFETVFSNVGIPWGLAWLPDGSMLVGDKSGEITLVTKTNESTISTGFDDLYVRGQGGLLDILPHPNYENNKWIYFAYASNQGDGEGGNTKIVRAQIENNKLIRIEELYKATPNSTKGVHFGSRMVIDNQGYLYFTIGDRGNRDENPQDITRDGGKIYRIKDDGSIPDDNPFLNEAGAKAAIYSYGHRNQQGMDIHPVTQEIWTHEHGPKGGDEINITKKGANYGWPVITYGVNYSGTTITEKTQKEGMEQPLYYWTPSIAPSGMAFVTGDKYPDWKGHLLVGSLKFQYLELLKLKNNQISERLKIAEDIGRLRTVKMGPDGYVYLGVEGKGIVKIIPN